MVRERRDHPYDIPGRLEIVFDEVLDSAAWRRRRRCAKRVSVH